MNEPDESQSVEPVLRLGSVPIVNVQSVPKRIAMLLWGPAGCGKTTLCSTAPGKKLWINFDPDGTSSVAGRNDIDVADFSTEPSIIVNEFKRDDPFGLNKIVKSYDSVVFDSLTAFAQLALVHSVSKCNKSTIEAPGIQAYGMRNVFVEQAVLTLMRITRRHNKHVFFIAHEAAPKENDEGVVVFITMSLGGQLTYNAPRQFSEVWTLEDTGKERRIAVRPCRLRKPMKTRMFASSKSPEFIWRYNAETGEGEGIADWYDAWLDSDDAKINLPS